MHYSNAASSDEEMTLSEEQQISLYGCTTAELEEQYFTDWYERIGYAAAIMSLINDAIVEMNLFDDARATQSLNKAKYVILHKLDKVAEIEANLEKIQKLNTANAID